MRMKPLMALILSSSITCASGRIVAIEDRSGQLLLEDPADIHSVLARAVHDVSQGGAPDEGRVF